MDVGVRGRGGTADATGPDIFTAVQSVGLFGHVWTIFLVGGDCEVGAEQQVTERIDKAVGQGQLLHLIIMIKFIQDMYSITVHKYNTRTKFLNLTCH